MGLKFKWRHQYDEVADEIEREKGAYKVIEDSLTQQHFTKDADINEIVRRFGVTDGAIPPQVMDPSYYGDFSDVPDFRAAMDRTREAQEHFNALPADLRERFANDPVRLWDFVQREENAEEAVKLGLLHKRAIEIPPEPTRVIVVPDETTKIVENPPKTG